MSSRISFYSVVLALVLGSGYVGYRLFFPATEEASKAKAPSNEDAKSKSSAGMKFSNSLTHPSDSVWTDNRLKTPGVGNIGAELKSSAEVENNLKILTGLYDQGSDDEFLKKIKDLIAQNPNVKEYAALLGDYYYNEGNWTEAETAVKRLIELDPQNTFAKTALAEILAVQGRYDDGLELGKQVLQAAPTNMDAMYGILSNTEMSGREAQGMKILQDHFEANPANGNAAAVLAAAQASRGDIKTAEATIEKGLANDPENSNLLSEGAKIKASGGDFSKAAEFAEKGAEHARDQNEKNTNLSLAWQSWLEIGKLDEAERAIRKIEPQSELTKQALIAVEAKRSAKK